MHLGPDPSEPLVLGPVLRYVDGTSATVWVRTRDAVEVTVTRAGRSWTARTFGVHGDHHALVVCDGLEPGSDDAYEVALDGEPVWPRAGMPPSRIRTLDPERLPRFAFGSCRTTGTHDRAGTEEHGVDALRTLALALRDDPRADWPDLLLLLGDQVYADTTPHPELEAFMRSRRDVSQPPFEEIKDYPEYAELYRLAWSDEIIRWVLSNLPSAMIFDDHDIRDDWNTSWSWRRDIRATTWWQERIVSGLASYWVYQHLGNLSPAALAQEEVWRRVAAHADAGERARPHRRPQRLAARADAEPGVLPVELHPRARRLPRRRRRLPRGPRPAARRALDARPRRAAAGSTSTLRGGHRHVFVGTSLPFLLPPGLHDFEAIDEAVAQGGVRAPGRRRRGAGAAQHRPRALGRVQPRLRRGVRDRHGPRPRAPRAGPGDDHVPLRGRPQLLPRRGHRPRPVRRPLANRPGRVLTDPQPDAAWACGS